MSLTNIQFFKSNNINSLNHKLWDTIYNRGTPFNFGGGAETKEAKEVFAVVQIYGKALKQLYEGKLPKGWKFGEAANKVYIEMLKNWDKEDQPYTYGQRLHLYDCVEPGEWDFKSIDVINQMYECSMKLEDAIKTGAKTNRICGVIWTPYDMFLENPPCFNWFQVRVTEKNKVSLRILFRSHDYGNACFANWGAIIRAFQDEVIDPAGGELEELICVSASAHLYNNDMDMVEAYFGKLPQKIKKMMRA